MANKRGKTYEAPDMAAMMKRTLRAMVRRAEEGDREAVTAMAEVERAVKDAMVDTARAAHYGRGDYSWNEIARELGVTRQAAQKRFALPDDSLGWPVEQPEPTRSRGGRASDERCEHGYYLHGGTGTCPMPADQHERSAS